MTVWAVCVRVGVCTCVMWKKTLLFIFTIVYLSETKINKFKKNNNVCCLLQLCRTKTGPICTCVCICLDFCSLYRYIRIFIQATDPQKNLFNFVLAMIFIRKIFRLKVEKILRFVIKYVILKQTQLIFKPFPLECSFNLVSIKYVYWVNERRFNIYGECWTKFNAKKTLENMFIFFSFRVPKFWRWEKKDKIHS